MGRRVDPQPVSNRVGFLIREQCQGHRLQLGRESFGEGQGLSIESLEQDESEILNGDPERLIE